MNSKNHKTIVVTGTSSGIGFATAKRLGQGGHCVFATVQSDDDFGQITDLGFDTLTPLCLDITRPDSVAQAARQVQNQLGDRGLDALVNNAGFMLAAPLEITPIEIVRRHFDVNVTGHLAVTQALLPLLRRAQGRIVNIGSISGSISTPFSGPYNASKAALRAMSDALRLELAPWNIGVSLIEPGTVLTPMWNNTLKRTEALRHETPAESAALYREVFESMPQFIDNAQNNGWGLSADQVARVIERVIEAQRPRPYYVVGLDARLRLLLSHLPARFRDRLIALWVERYAPRDRR